MDRIRSIGRFGLAGGLFLLSVGMTLVAGAALAAGSWWLAPQPWIGLGLDLLILGLAATAIFAVLRVVMEPVGWLRLLAVPPALFVAVMWWFLLAIGFPTTARVPHGTRVEVATLLYTVPALILLAVLVTLMIALPLAIAWLLRSRSASTRGA